MAITPNERREIGLKELDKVADYLESQIDRELREPSLSHADTTLVFIEPTGFYIKALFDKPSIREDLKQRYLEKGWKDVEFRAGGGDPNGGYITVELIPPSVPGEMVTKIVTGFIGIILIPMLFFVLLFYFPFLVLAGILLLFFYFAFFSRS